MSSAKRSIGSIIQKYHLVSFAIFALALIGVGLFVTWPMDSSSVGAVQNSLQTMTGSQALSASGAFANQNGDGGTEIYLPIQAGGEQNTQQLQQNQQSSTSGDLLDEVQQVVRAANLACEPAGDVPCEDGMPFTVVGDTEPIIYVSSSTGAPASGPVGFGFNDEDILKYDNGTWSKFFDGSDVGLAGSADVNAFHVLSSGNILMSFDREISLDAIVFDDADIALFTASSLGNVTTGTFSMFFDGSQNGLDDTDNAHDIDAISENSSGELIFSTLGRATITRSGASSIKQQDEDLARKRNSDNLVVRFFDGSDVGLNNSGPEDVWGVHMNGNDDIYLSPQGDYIVSGVSGNGNDILLCGPPNSYGISTSCTFSLFWDGDLHSFADEVIDGFSIENSGTVLAANLLGSESDEPFEERDLFIDTDEDDFEDDAANEAEHPESPDDLLEAENSHSKTPTIYMPILP